MSFLAAIFLSLCLGIFPAVSRGAMPAQAPAGAAYYRPDAQPLPAATAVDSSYASWDDAVVGMGVSYPFGNQDPKVTEGKETTNHELSLIQDFLLSRGQFSNLSGVPAARKEIWLTRYEIGDPRFVDMLIDAKRQGLVGKIHLITDLNEALEGNFTGNQMTDTDYGNARRKSGENAEAFERFRQAGFGRDGDFVLASPPLYRHDGDTETPLMHEKQLALIVRDGQGNPLAEIGGRPAGLVTFGTANAETHVERDGDPQNPPITRYNRVITVKDPKVVRWLLDHAAALETAFRQGKRIDEVESIAPVRIRYGNGDYTELAATDGRFNPNDRIVKLLLSGLRAGTQLGGTSHAFQKLVRRDAAFARLWNETKPGETVIDRINLSEFVFTDKHVLAALTELKRQRPELEIFGVFDGKFLSLHGAGFADALAGLPVVRHFGGMVAAMNSAGARANKLYGYLEGLRPGQGERSPDGIPVDMKLHHDKTAQVFYHRLIDGQPTEEQRARTWTGSWNLSGHIANAEVQIETDTSGKSAYASSIERSIRGVVEKKPENYRWLPEMTAKVTIADFIGQGARAIPNDAIERVMDTLGRGDFDAFEREILALRQVKSSLAESLQRSDDDVRANLDRLRTFFNWYLAKNREPSGRLAFPPTVLFLRSLTAIDLLNHPEVLHYDRVPAEDRPWLAIKLEQALDAMLYRAGMAQGEVRPQIEEAWKLLALPGAPPPPLPPEPARAPSPPRVMSGAGDCGPAFRAL